MKTRKEIAELAATLTRRNLKANVASDVMLLCRMGASAETAATNLCNVPNYQAKFNKRKAGILKRLLPLCSTYQVRFEVAGDPSGYCLRMFAAGNLSPIPGNTWGGDESGYGI